MTGFPGFGRIWVGGLGGIQLEPLRESPASRATHFRPLVHLYCFVSILPSLIETKRTSKEGSGGAGAQHPRSTSGTFCYSRPLLPQGSARTGLGE